MLVTIVNHKRCFLIKRGPRHQGRGDNRKLESINVVYYKSNKKLIAEASVITTASSFANVNNNGNANNNGASNADGAVRPI